MIALRAITFDISCCCCVRLLVARRTDRIRGANGSCHACARVCWEYPVIGSFQHTLARSCGNLLGMPTLESGTAKVGRVNFYNFRKNPVLRVPPRYWRCCALYVPATFVLSASNPREPRLPRSLSASLLGAIAGLMGSGGWSLVRLGVPCPSLPAGCRLVELCLVPHGRGAI